MDREKKLSKFEELIKNLEKVLYHIARVESYNRPDFTRFNKTPAEIILIPENLRVLDESVLYASQNARGHGSQSSIKGVYNSEKNRYTLTINPDPCAMKKTESNNHPLIDETEQFLKFLSKGIENYKMKSGHR